MLTCVWLFSTLRTVAHPVPLSMGLGGQNDGRRHRIVLIREAVCWVAKSWLILFATPWTIAQLYSLRLYVKKQSVGCKQQISYSLLNHCNSESFPRKYLHIFLVASILQYQAEAYTGNFSRSFKVWTHSSFLVIGPEFASPYSWYLKNSCPKKSAENLLNQNSHSWSQLNLCFLYSPIS